MVFGLMGIDVVSDWLDTWGGGEGRKAEEGPASNSKNLLDILRSVVSSKKARRKENDTG